MSKLLCIDAGHGAAPAKPGGKADPGAVAPTGEREAVIALAWAKTLARACRAEGLKVVETRPDERFVTLTDRARISNSAGAGLFLSLHCDASSNPNRTGAHTLYARPSKRGKEVAAALQLTVAALLGGDPGAISHDEKPHTNYNGGVYVLRHTRAPAVLVEMGFLTNPADLARLLSADAREVACTALARRLRILLDVPAPVTPAPSAPVEVVIPPVEPRLSGSQQYHAPDVPVLHTITLPEPPEDAEVLGVLSWAREAARAIGAQAADMATEAGETALADALDRLHDELGTRLPWWLPLRIVWPELTRLARRATERAA